MAKTGKRAAPAQRLRFPEDEARAAWLSALLEAYALVDEGIDRAIRRFAKRTGRELACGKGCETCCRTQRDIPLYPHELTGIYWYCMEQTKQPTREVLRHQLRGHSRGGPCPFLTGGVCAIHPLRPTGCRLFNVFGTPCRDGEDPYHTRSEDVLRPDRKLIRGAFVSVLSLYGVGENGRGAEEDAERIINTKAVSVHDVAWWKLAERMGRHRQP